MKLILMKTNNYFYLKLNWEVVRKVSEMSNKVTNYSIIVEDKGINPAYLAIFEFRRGRALKSIKVGIAQQAIQMDLLVNLRIPIPPIIFE